jgi:hypothetical protein
MNRDEILSLEAGRELDALVAQYVKCEDLRIYECPHRRWPILIYCECPTLPHYSTDIAAAWEVVEKMHEQHGVDVNGLSSSGFACTIYGAAGHWRAYDEVSAPLAICRAALNAMLPNEEDE